MNGIVKGNWLSVSSIMFFESNTDLIIIAIIDIESTDEANMVIPNTFTSSMTMPSIVMSSRGAICDPAATNLSTNRNMENGATQSTNTLRCSMLR